ncbi:MAG: hypothetical protein U0936_26895 [Planctomycetaceae bacterium]
MRVFTKSRIADPPACPKKVGMSHREQGIEFPGFAFEGWVGQIRVSPKNERKSRDRLMAITRRNRGVSMRHRFTELRRCFQGWVGSLSLDHPGHEGLASLLTIRQKLTANDLNRTVRTRMPGGVGGVQPQG